MNHRNDIIDIINGFNKPSWMFHPFKRLKHNRIIKDISIIADIIHKYNSELAYIISYNKTDKIVELSYCYDGTGDMLSHRKIYIFDGTNHLERTSNFIKFCREVLTNVKIKIYMH